MMSDIDVKLMAEELGKSIEDLSEKVEQELHAAIENVAQAAHASMIARVQGWSMDPKNRQDYLRALQYAKIDDSSYLIYLDGEWPKKLEEGYPGYSIKDKLLASQKRVKVGSRAGEPWVRTSKEGKKYAAVPFEHKPFSGENSSGNLADDIKKLVAQNMAGKKQSILETFNDLEGRPLTGKVATVSKNSTDVKNLKGLTKYQHVSDSGKVSSIYMTYRMVHQDSPGWQHPGHKGYQLFKQAEEYVERELENIIKTIL